MTHRVSDVLTAVNVHVSPKTQPSYWGCIQKRVKQVSMTQGMKSSMSSLCEV